MTVEQALCRWAEQTYGLSSVVEVQFDFKDDGDYSELTPGEGPYMEVEITFLGRGERQQRHTRREARYDTGLIREVLAVALKQSLPSEGAE